MWLIYLIILSSQNFTYLKLISSLTRFDFATATTFFSSLHQLKYNLLNRSTLALFGEEILHVIELSTIKQECSSTSALKDYLQINAFLIWWWWSKKGYLKLYKEKPPVGSHGWCWERRFFRRSRSDSWDVNISFNRGQSLSSGLSGNAKQKGFKVI